MSKIEELLLSRSTVEQRKVEDGGVEGGGGGGGVRWSAVNVDTPWLVGPNHCLSHQIDVQLPPPFDIWMLTSVGSR